MQMWQQVLNEMRCTEATLRAFGISGVCPTTGTGVLAALKSHGWKVTPLLNPARTDGLWGLADFVRDHKQGSYYVWTTDHAMALVDGTITDTSERDVSNRIKVSAVRVSRS